MQGSSQKNEGAYLPFLGNEGSYEEQLVGRHEANDGGYGNPEG